MEKGLQLSRDGNYTLQSYRESLGSLMYPMLCVWPELRPTRSFGLARDRLREKLFVEAFLLLFSTPQVSIWIVRPCIVIKPCRFFIYHLSILSMHVCIKNNCTKKVEVIERKSNIVIFMKLSYKFCTILVKCGKIFRWLNLQGFPRFISQQPWFFGAFPRFFGAFPRFFDRIP